MKKHFSLSFVCQFQLEKKASQSSFVFQFYVAYVVFLIQRKKPTKIHLLWKLSTSVWHGCYSAILRLSSQFSCVESYFFGNKNVEPYRTVYELLINECSFITWNVETLIGNV